MSLSAQSSTIQLPPQHFLFIEKYGPFDQTAFAAWQELHAAIKNLSNPPTIIGAMALFKHSPEMIYRAGFVLESSFVDSHPQLLYTITRPNAYAKYTYIGPYEGLGPSWEKVIEQAQSEGLQISEDYFVERYLNNPETTEPQNLATELMVPTGLKVKNI